MQVFQLGVILLSMGAYSHIALGAESHHQAVNQAIEELGNVDLDADPDSQQAKQPVIESPATTEQEPETPATTDGDDTPTETSTAESTKITAEEEQEIAQIFGNTDHLLTQKELGMNTVITRILSFRTAVKKCHPGRRRSYVCSFDTTGKSLKKGQTIVIYGKSTCIWAATGTMQDRNTAVFSNAETNTLPKEGDYAVISSAESAGSPSSDCKTY